MGILRDKPIRGLEDEASIAALSELFYSLKEAVRRCESPDKIVEMVESSSLIAKLYAYLVEAEEEGQSLDETDDVSSPDEADRDEIDIEGVER